MTPASRQPSIHYINNTRGSHHSREKNDKLFKIYTSLIIKNHVSIIESSTNNPNSSYKHKRQKERRIPRPQTPKTHQKKPHTKCINLHKHEKPSKLFLTTTLPPADMHTWGLEGYHHGAELAPVGLNLISILRLGVAAPWP